MCFCRCPGFEPVAHVAISDWGKIVTDEHELTDAKQRVLDAAEDMFMEHGYAAITLRDLAERLDMRQASLYYHFPDGKEQLYIEMAERAFQTHSEGMRRVMVAAGDDLRGQLLAVTDWFAQHRPINVIGMMYADLPALSRERAQRLAQSAYEALFFPLRDVFVAAQQRGEVREINPEMLAGFFLALLDGITFSQTQPVTVHRGEMAEAAIDMVLYGVAVRGRGVTH